jgi:hypothetical protein
VFNPEPTELLKQQEEAVLLSDNYLKRKTIVGRWFFFNSLQLRAAVKPSGFLLDHQKNTFSTAGNLMQYVHWYFKRRELFQFGSASFHFENY